MAKKWSEDKILALREMVDKGESHAEIAAKLGPGFSRGGVSAQIMRQGFGAGREAAMITRRLNSQMAMGAKLAAVRAQDRPGPSKHKPRASKPPTPPTAPLAEDIEDDAASELDEPAPISPIWALKPHQCRWPLGDPNYPGFQFCTERADKERSLYCAAHRAMAYLPVELKPLRAPSEAQIGIRTLKRAPVEQEPQELGV